MTLLKHDPDVRCDGCELTIPIAEMGRWLTVQTVVGTPEKFQEMYEAESRGEMIHMHGDFCSLRCLSGWAMNAETLRSMEALWDQEEQGEAR